MSSTTTSATRTPVLVLTGFLGSGKTTTLKHILDTTTQRLAIIENEVGASLGLANELSGVREFAKQEKHEKFSEKSHGKCGKEHKHTHKDEEEEEEFTVHSYLKRLLSI